MQKNHNMRKASIVLTIISVIYLATSAQAQDSVTGVVYHDSNNNGVLDHGEKGIPGVMVSNGRDIVLTDHNGEYEISATDDSIIFLIKPSGWSTSVDENNIPKFYNIISSEGAGGDVFPGLEPTGHWPESVDFALYKQDESKNLRVVVFGDTQPRTIEEINYLAHDSVQELIGIDAAFGVTLGDLVFDELNLFDPLNQVVGQIGIPWRHIIGNHDIDFSAENNWDARGAYHRTYGPSWYAFSWGHAHFVVIDNIQWIVEGEERYYRTGLGSDQLKFIENFIANIPDDEPVVFMAHIPWVESTSWRDEAEKKALFDIMASHSNTLSLVAHTHRHFHYYIDQDDGWPLEQPHHMISIGTVCGAWWRGAPDEYGIPHGMMRDGSPTGYSFLDFQGNDWKLTYKAARRPSDFQMHLYGPSEITKEELSNGIQFYANIFNALPDARVEMLVDMVENPIPMNLTEGVTDPVFEAMREREQALDNINWIGTSSAHPHPRHLYEATLPEELETGAYVVRIRSEDSWHTYEGRRIIRIID